MFYQQKRNIVSLISTLLISVAYYLYVFHVYKGGMDPSTADLHFWGAFILIMMPVHIGFKIMMMIIFSIINYIATREEMADKSDEFEKLIELKATRNCYHAFMLGFILSIASLVMNYSPAVMFHMLFISLTLATAVWDLTMLYYYKKGVRYG